MKKVRVSLWVETGQKERLEDLSRKNRALIGGYVHEALEDLLRKYEEPGLRLTQDKRDNVEAQPETEEGCLAGGQRRG